MIAREESRRSVADTVKLVLSIVLLLCGTVGFYYFANYLLIYRVLGLLGLVLVSVVIILTTVSGRNFLHFLNDARVEVRKVVWPTRQETLQATLVVVALVFLVGLILWLLDMGLFWCVSVLTGQGK